MPKSVSEIEIRARLFATASDSRFQSQRLAFAALDPEQQYDRAKVFVRSNPDLSLEAFFESTAVPWEDVLAVRVTEKRRVPGLVAGLIIGATVGAVVGGFAGGAASDSCGEIVGSYYCSPDNNRTRTFGFGALIGGLSGAALGGAIGVRRGVRRSTEWRK